MKKLSIVWVKIILLSIILLAAGCTSTRPGYVTVYSGDGNVSISVPSGWNTDDKTIAGTLIGVSDPANHEYVVVSGLPRASLGANSTIEAYLAQVKTTAVSIVPDGVWGNSSPITMGIFKGLTTKLVGTWKEDNTNTTFWVNVFANNNYYYAIVGFTSTSLVNAHQAELQTIIDSFKIPDSTVSGSWKPYTFPGSAIVASLLFIVGLGLIVLGRRLQDRVRVPHPGQVLKLVHIVFWALLMLFFLVSFTVLTVRTQGATRTGLGPIFPITAACAVGTFIYLVCISRRDGVLAALGNGLVGAAAGPMVFEFPFDLIVIPQINAPASFLAAYFVPLDIAVLITLSLLLISRRVFLTRYSLYAFGAMFLVFAVWAEFGFAYPSTPLSFALNAISKVLGFIAVAALFSMEPKQTKQAEVKIEAAGNPP
jgi:hypothetical protein